MSFVELSDAEQGGLRAALPKLWSLAEEMKTIDRPLAEWKKEEVLAFLATAVVAATSAEKRPDQFSPDFEDRVPF